MQAAVASPVDGHFLCRISALRSWRTVVNTTGKLQTSCSREQYWAVVRQRRGRTRRSRAGAGMDAEGGGPQGTNQLAARPKSDTRNSIESREADHADHEAIGGGPLNLPGSLGNLCPRAG